MDSVLFQEMLSEKINKWCRVTLKNGEIHEGNYTGTTYGGTNERGYGTIVMHIENKGKGTFCFEHPDVLDIKFYD